jgi:hypothetical protein
VSHHVSVVLPDGRLASADYRQPIVHVMRRINAALATMTRCPSADDLAMVARWLDANPDQACTWDQMVHDTCTHPPATPDEYEPPRYVERPAGEMTLW